MGVDMTKLSVSILSLVALTSCAISKGSCEREFEDFEGRFSGTAIALENGDLFLNLTPDCSLTVDGGFSFHQHVAEVWKDAEYGHDHWRALTVNLVGDIEFYEREHDVHVLVLSKPGEVSREVDREDAARAFDEGIGRSIDGKIID